MVALPLVLEAGFVAPARGDGSALDVEPAVQVAALSVLDSDQPAGPVVAPSDVAACINEEAGRSGGLEQLAGKVDRGAFGDGAESEAETGAVLYGGWRGPITQLQGLQTDLRESGGDRLGGRW